MSYKKISFTFATILFISLLNLIYSNSWARANSETGFNPDETVCAGNKIGVKYKSKTEYTVTHEFKVSSIIGHKSIWAAYVYQSKGGQFIRAHEGSTYRNLDSYANALGRATLENYVEFRFINKVSSLEDLFNVEKDNLCNNIEEIDLDWIDFSQITSFKNAFKGLSNLKSINFKSNWKNCRNQTSLRNTKPRPKVITSMLQGCTSLESVDLSDFDTSLVQDMSSLLKGCKELIAIDLTNFIFPKETIAQDMLTGIEKLKYISLDNITGYTEQITSFDIFNNNTNLKVCQNEDAPLIQQVNDFCMDYEVVDGEIKAKPSSNFIVLYYSQNCYYENGFKGSSNHRNGKYLISYYEDLINETTPINITEDSEGLTLTIYFYSPQKSLEKFFDVNEDPNMKYVISMDLSNFVSSKVVNMNSMFYGCNSILSIDLRNFNTTKVTDMSNLFYNCTNLQVLYMNDFKILENTATENMFYNVNNLEYLGIDHVEDINKAITGSPLNSINDLIVCQSEKLITNSGARNICCIYDREKDLCISDNYIIVNYNESSDFTYDSGFKVGSDFRKRISFIIKDNVMFASEEKLEIKPNTKIEIHIFENLNSLEKLLSKEIDDKVKYINSLDFSHLSLDTSLITNMNSLFNGCSSLKSLDLSVFDTSSVSDMCSMFYGCSSLELLDLSFFDTSSVSDMDSMFYGCSSLKLLDLSVFDTSSVTNMNSMFYGCSSLEFLDLSNFKTSLVTNMNSMFNGCTSLELLNLYSFEISTVTSADNIFDGLEQLKYINLYNVIESDYIKKSYLNQFNNPSLKVCQTKDNLQQGTNICNKEGSQSESQNYLVIYYTNSIEYKNGFTNEYRKGIDKIIISENEKNPTENFRINTTEIDGDKIEIYLLMPLMSLENFFNSDIDTNAKYIRSIDLSHLDLSFLVNLNSVFKGCSSLESITFPNIDIKGLVNMKSMFYGCSSLKSLNLSKFDTSSVTNMNSMFYNCNSLTLLNLSNFNTSLVNYMDSMFYGCSSLEFLDLSAFNTSSISKMSFMFYQCNHLKSLDLSSFITSSVTNMDSMFYGCSSLELLDLSNFNTSLVTNMNSIFYGCSSLKFLDIYSFDMKSVTSANNIFGGSNKLKYINIYHVENSGDYLKTSGFSGINSLIVCQKEKIFIGTNAINIEDKCCYYDIQSGDCESDTTNFMVVYYGKNTEYSDGEGFAKDFREGIKFIINNDHNSKINGTEKLNIKAGNRIEIYFSSVTNLQNFFYNNKDSNVKNITSIDISHLDASLVTNFNFMFSGSNSLKSIDLTNFNTSSVKSMASMFQGCDSLISVDLSNFDTSSVSQMYNMFKGCQSLEYVDLSSFNTSSVKRMDLMFDGCSKLQYLDLSNFDTSEVTQLNSMFIRCTSLKVLDISSFDMINVKKYDSMFKGVNLRYLNLYYAKDFKVDDQLNKMDNLTVCQKETILNNENIKRKCCYFDLLTDECISSNFILLNYGKNIIYENGFGLEKSKIDSVNKFRTNSEAYFIINRDYNKKLNSKDKLNINAGKKLGIYFLSNVTTMENYFNSEIDPNTKDIVSIDLSHFNTANVDNMAQFFYGCESLQSIYPLNSAEDSLYFDTSLVTNMNSMFYGCENLRLLILSNFETSLVSDMGSMLYGCGSLESIDLSSFDTSLVTNMKSIFDGCSSLKILDLSHFNTSKVSNMDSMFSGCKLLKYLDISAFNIESISVIENLFEETDNLSYINIFDIKDNEDIYFFNILSGLNKWKNLTVCQKEKFIIKGVLNSECCYFNVTSEQCESSNYITVYFGEKANYDNGFAFNEKGEEIRKGIDFIINGNHDKKINGNEKLNIRKGTKIEIYFSSSITSLENYFSSAIDPNMRKIISIDLTHFNFSSITSMSKTFYGCNLLKTILLYSVDTSNVVDMSSMFEGCSSLEVLDLSNIDTSSVTDMSSMFSGCESLKVLDISHFNMEKISKADTMFLNAKKIKYINLYDTKKAKEYISQSELKEISNLTVCQKGKIITNDNRIEKCCYYNLDNDECESTNYIIVYFGEKAEYDEGFLEYNYRDGIKFIINGVYNIKQNDKDNLIVLGGSKIEIHFSNALKSLEKFFSSELDPNMAKITSIDFSHFDASLIEKTASMLYGCSSLKSIDLSFFDTSKVDDMSNMFLNCSSLEILDLSTFDTSSVTKMNSMFSGCESLKFLDISNFNMEKITKGESMFNGIKNLKYVNLYNIPKSYNFINESGLDKIENLTVCQKQKIISSENITENCCYYDLNTNECSTSTNYIIIFYGDTAEYPNGFIKNEDDIQFREGIDFIINGEDHNKKLDGTTELILHKGSKIEVYFSNSIPLTSTQSYFDSTKDRNAGKIVSIDFHHFNSSNINDMSSMFYGCSSLKSLDLSNFDTSLATNINLMFYECSSLESLDLSNFDTSSVTNMDLMFSGCKSLKFLDISNFNMTLITSSKTMLDSVENLKYINLYYVQDPNKVLSDISNLQNVPIICQKKNKKILADAEAKCCYYNIKEEKCESTNFITIFFSKDVHYSQGFANDYRKDIQFIINKNSNYKISGEDDLFLPSGSRLEIYYSSPVESLENYFSKDYDINMENAVSIDLDNFDTSKVTSMKSTFHGCISLKSLDIYTINTSQVTNMNSMFSECIALESIDLSGFDLSSVVYMNYMFSGCSSLLSVDLSKTEANNVISTADMFNECKSLRYINLNKINTSLVTNMDYMFSGCSSLEYLDISHFSSAKATKIYSMFEEIKNLKYLSLYKAEDTNNVISKSILSNLSNLTVCQQEKILIGDNLIDKCCQYDIDKNECEYVNYIIVYYGENVKYQNGFKNNDRKISYKINVGDNDAQSDTDALDIEKDVPVKISFDSPLTSLLNFFYAEEDTNADKIISIDFSNFDSSKIENLESLFYGCSSLKSIDFSYFNSSLVTNMKSMFDRCSSLESIDLSSFDVSLVTTMKSMFSKCSSLKTIDLSNFNTPSLTDIVYMFYNCSSLESIDLSNFNTSLVGDFSNLFSGCTKLKYLDISSFNVEKPKNLDNVFTNVPLKYLNIYNINDSKNKIANTDLNNLINLTICQKNEIFTKEDKNYQCCKYNIETEMCEFSNYITVYFGDEVEYLNGFEFDNYGDCIKERKDKIDFIFIGNDQNPINGTQPFTLKRGSKIDIFFKNITSLEHFFDSLKDGNCENIISIDLTHLDSSSLTDLGSLFSGCISLQYIDFLNFDTSKVTNMEAMFEGCNSLKYIDLSNFITSLVTRMDSMFSGCNGLLSIYLSNFDTSSVENMASMFYGCYELESIDLSYFNTSLVTDMTNMFSDCQSLKVLDISNFNMENIKQSKNMFSEVKNLRYINTYNMIDSQNIIGQSDLKNIDDLIICGQANIMNEENSKCCYYDYKSENGGCTSTNYMIVYYGNDVEYPNGFQNMFRNDVSFIINKDLSDKLNTSATFYINARNKITIYFNSPLKTLESFFDINYDPNVENILSIDFTHFDFSEITDMNNLFTGCSSLESINFPDITTSKISNMNHMFFGCSQLLSVNLSLFNTEEVTDMSYMFYDCRSLQFLNFSNFNTSKVTKMNNMFYRCNSLEIVDLSSCETPLLTNLEKMFYKCQNLKEINLANFTTTSVTSMDEMFYDCNSLTYLDISNFDMINCNSYSNMFSNIDSLKYINLQNFKNDKAIGSAFNQAKDIVVCQKEKIITNRKVYYCCDYNFETKECETIPTTIISTIPTFIPEISNINAEKSDTQDINAYTQNSKDLIYSDEKETNPNDSTKTSNILDDSESFSETKEFIGSTEYYTEDKTVKTSSLIINNTKASTSIIEEYSNKEENTESLSSTSENNNEYSTYMNDNINEKTNKIDSKEYDTSNIYGTEKITSRVETQNSIASEDETLESTIPKLETKEPISSKIETKEPITSEVKTEQPKIETKEPITSQVKTEQPNIETKEPITSKVDTKEPISSIIDTQVTKTSKVDTQEPMTSKGDIQEQTDSKLDTKEPMTSKIENTDKSSSQNEYNTQNTSSPDAEKTEYISTKTANIDDKEQTSISSSINDNKEQITNIPSINHNTEQPKNSEIGENTEKITSHVPSENIEKTTKPSNIEKTSIVDNTEKENTQAPAKENTEKVLSTSSLPEQITNKPSIIKEPEPSTTPSNQEDIKHTTSTNYQVETTTSSPDEETPSTNKDDNKEVVHTNIPTSLNLTALSTNLVENPNNTIIENVVQNTEVINIPEEPGVTLVGLSHINIMEKIVTFFIYFALGGLFSGSKGLKFPVELTTRRVLRVLQTQEAVCELVDEEPKGGLYAYSCKVEVTSGQIQSIKEVKIVNQFEFSGVNYTVGASVSPIIEQYLDNIQEIGNKFDFLINSALYTLEDSKIDLGERQIFNISGIINGTKPKFEKVDLNLSVSVEYENKTEEKQLECSVIDIIENNYTLSCVGIKNTNFSLKNAMSVIEDEILIIKFGEGENTTILYYTDTDETKTRYSLKFFNSKSGGIGAGGIVAIILACLAAIAALIAAYYCMKKESKKPKSIQESTMSKLKI